MAHLLPSPHARRFTWVAEGLLLDEHTRGVSAELMTYNAELRVFGAARVTFDFAESGSIQASTRCERVKNRYR